MALCQGNSMIVSGYIDVLLQIKNGFVVIDHKSFPGSKEEAMKKAAYFVGQVGFLQMRCRQL